MFADAALNADADLSDAAHRGLALLHGGGEATDASGAAHALYWLTADLAADRPTVIAVDDAHWADATSLRWLAYLAGRIENVALAVVVAARPSDDSVLAAVAAAASDRLELEPLSLAATREVVEARLGSADDEFVATCHEATGGNPLYLRELLREVESAGVAPTAANAGRAADAAPRHLARLVNERIARLPAAASRVAAAVAVLGTAVLVRTAAALAGLDVKTAGQAADALAAAGVFAPGLPLDFSHPIVRTRCTRSCPRTRGQRTRPRGAPPGRRRCARPRGRGPPAAVRAGARRVGRRAAACRGPVGPRARSDRAGGRLPAPGGHRAAGRSRPRRGAPRTGRRRASDGRIGPPR